MSSHSHATNTRTSDCLLSSLCTSLTHVYATYKNEKITQNHQKERATMRSQCESRRLAICATTIDMLNDDVLLEIFDLVRPVSSYGGRFFPIWKWHTLVCVCRRWREIIFASPLRLDLRLLCTHGTPVGKDLGCWPPTFPIAIDYGYRRDMSQSLTPDDEDNVFAALKQRERVRHLALSVTDSALLEEMVTLMQEPFPELRVLAISSQCQNVPVLPDDFLGGSAPRLQEIRLSGIPFPALPTLLASASNLVGLLLDDIPRTGHRISPAAFAACLAVLPRLKLLSIEFRSPPSRTGRTHLPPETRAVLPSLTSFMFTGESAFLEVILARVDAPQLDSINIRYTDRLEFNFQATEFSKFIERSAIKPTRFGHGEICLEDDDISFCYFRKTNPDLPTISIQIPFDQPITVIVVNMTQVLNQTSAILSDVVRLKVTMKCSSPFWRDDMSNHIRWLELFRPFTSVMKLRIYEELAESISHALEYREAGTQVLPALKLICVEDQRVRYMKELIAYLRERGKLPSNGNEGLDSDDSE